MTQLHYHPPSGDRDVCLYDHERWPCTVQQIRTQVADEIERDIRDSARTEWTLGMKDAAAVARGPHN